MPEDAIDPVGNANQPSGNGNGRCSGGSARGLRPAALLAGWAICLTLAIGAVHGQQRAASRIDVRISAGRLTLTAHDVALREVLQRVAQTLNARLWISGDLGDRRGYWNLTRVPVAEAVSEIARPASTAIVFGRDGTGSRDDEVREIYVFGVPGEAVASPAAAPTQAQRVRQLAGMLADADSEVRRRAAAELGGIEAAESVSVLGQALGDRDGRVRVEVVESLGRIGTDEAMRLVGQAGLGARDPEVEKAAIRVLEGSNGELARMMLSAIQSRAQGAQPASARPGEPGSLR